MRLLHVINEVCAAPWLITQDMLQRIIDILNARIAGEEKLFLTGEPQPPSAMRVEGRTAVIPVEGVLANRVSAFEKACGVRDYSDIAKDLTEAGRLARQGSLDRVVMKVNSPGGQSVGLPLVSQMVDSFERNHGIPLYAHVTGQAASAALYLIAGAQEIAADHGTNLGGVGAYVAFMDRSKELEKAGRKMEVISSGELKTTGLPGTPLTAAQRQYLQARIDSIAGEFKDRLRTLRGVPDEAMDGRVFDAREAVRLGLATTATYDFDRHLAGRK